MMISLLYAPGLPAPTRFCRMAANRLLIAAGRVLFASGAARMIAVGDHREREGPMPRLFTALEIPADVGLALSAYRGGLPGARWIDPENYHITLRFIGDVDERTAHDVASVLGDRRRRDPLTVTFDGLDSFGGARPRAVFARVI